MELSALADPQPASGPSDVEAAALAAVAGSLPTPRGWRLLRTSERVEARWSSDAHWASFTAKLHPRDQDRRQRPGERLVVSAPVGGATLTLSLASSDEHPVTLGAVGRLVDALGIAAVCA